MVRYLLLFLLFLVAVSLSAYIGCQLHIRTRIKSIYSNPKTAEKLNSIIPINFDSTDLYSTHIVYEIIGKIKDIKESANPVDNQGKGFLVSLDTTSKLPAFFVREGYTTINRPTLSDLKLGSSIRLSTRFYPKDSRWVVTGVSIQSK